MIFERNDSGLVYAPPALDLTNELIRKYNARFPPGAAKKPAARGEARRRAGEARGRQAGGRAGEARRGAPEEVRAR